MAIHFIQHLDCSGIYLRIILVDISWLQCHRRVCCRKKTNLSVAVQPEAAHDTEEQCLLAHRNSPKLFCLFLVTYFLVHATVYDTPEPFP